MVLCCNTGASQLVLALAPSTCAARSRRQAGRQAAIGFTPLLGNDINIPLNTHHPLPHTTQ